jgi:hypothetical protein
MLFMGFVESVKLAFAAWQATLSLRRTWLAATIPAIAFNILWASLMFTRSEGGPESLSAFLFWTVAAGAIGLFLYLPALAAWHERRLFDGPIETIPVRLAWTRRDLRYLWRWTLAVFAVLLVAGALSFVRGLFSAIRDEGTGIPVLGVLFDLGFLWLAFALSAKLWLAPGMVLLDAASDAPRADIAPKDVASALLAAIMPAKLLAAIAAFFDSTFAAVAIGTINGIVVPMAVGATLALLHRRGAPQA